MSEVQQMMQDLGRRAKTAAASLAYAPAAQKTAALMAAADAVIAAQSEIIEAPGEPDGRVGRQTRSAIRAYQEREHLRMDAYASKALLDRLRSGRE